MLNSKNGVFNPFFQLSNEKTAFMDKSRVEPTIFFIEKLLFSLKLFFGHFYGQSFIKTVRGPLQGYSCLRPVAGILLKFGSFAFNWKCDACGIVTFVTAYRDASCPNTMNMNVNKG